MKNIIISIKDINEKLLLLSLDKVSSVSTEMADLPYSTDIVYRTVIAMDNGNRFAVPDSVEDILELFKGV